MIDIDRKADMNDRIFSISGSLNFDRRKPFHRQSYGTDYYKADPGLGSPMISSLPLNRSLSSTLKKSVITTDVPP